MSAWLQECPNCMYVARDLSIISADESDAIREIGFIEAGLSDDMPDLAIRFMRRAYIDEQTGQIPDAVRRLLHAAWVLDDFELDAVGVRAKAAAMIESMGTQADADLQVLRLDLLRRSGAFADVIAEGSKLGNTDLNIDQRSVVSSEIEAARQGLSEARQLIVRREGR